jgi:dTDP-4-amino-4,6-dideoxy-D-galactose acyltransferase
VTELCEFLDWDSAFFARRIARVTVRRLTAPLVGQILSWAGRQHIDCLYFLADLSDPATLRLASRHRFELVDVRVVLEAHGPAMSVRDHPTISIRPATADDVPALGRIARKSHHDSRFYSDGRFQHERCDDLYSTWIEKSCSGWADVVFVADEGPKIAGYITGHATSAGCGKIGLLGVDAAGRGHGCGHALVQSLFQWFGTRGISQVTVVTQGKNREALLFYERCGFRVHAIDLWYHRWSEEQGAGP